MLGLRWPVLGASRKRAVFRGRIPFCVPGRVGRPAGSGSGAGRSGRSAQACLRQRSKTWSEGSSLNSGRSTQSPGMRALARGITQPPWVCVAMTLQVCTATTPRGCAPWDCTRLARGCTAFSVGGAASAWACPKARIACQYAQWSSNCGTDGEIVAYARVFNLWSRSRFDEGGAHLSFFTGLVFFFLPDLVERVDAGRDGAPSLKPLDMRSFMYCCGAPHPRAVRELSTRY